MRAQRVAPRRRAQYPRLPENMDMPATVFRDLVAEAPIPARGILSQTLSNENGIGIVHHQTSHHCLGYVDYYDLDRYDHRKHRGLP